MHVLQHQRIVRQLSRPICGIPLIHWTLVRVETILALSLAGRYPPSRVRRPHRLALLRHTGLRTEHRVGLPLSVHPRLGIDTCGHRWGLGVERDIVIEGIRLNPSSHGRDIRARELGGARMHDVGHIDQEDKEGDISGGR